MTWEEAEQDLNRKKLQKGTMPPELDAARWINPPKTEEGYELTRLSHLRGKAVLLDFWATWCSPCVGNLPKIQELYEHYKDKGLVVIAIHASHNADNLDAFLKERDVAFPVMLDTGETFRRYGIKGIPQYILIGRDGKLVSSGLQGNSPGKGVLEAALESS